MEGCIETTTDLEQFYAESNINKHGVDMNNIELSPLFQELTSEKAAAIQGGAAYEFFENANFSGASTAILTSGEPYVSDLWNDKVSSIKVYSGEWAFWSDVNYSGSAIILGPGDHDLTTLNGGVYNDVISSVKVNVE